MKSIARNDKRRIKQTIPHISSVSLFLMKSITQIKASMTLFAFAVLISQFLENDLFSIEMDMCMQFNSSKGLEKH